LLYTMHLLSFAMLDPMQGMIRTTV
jgi:hypothetical protein